MSFLWRHCLDNIGNLHTHFLRINLSLSRGCSLQHSFSTKQPNSACKMEVPIRYLVDTARPPVVAEKQTNVVDNEDNQIDSVAIQENEASADLDINMNSTETGLNWATGFRPTNNKRLNNAQLLEYAKQRGLPPPMFEWIPRFNALPNEIFYQILSYSNFHVTNKHRASPWGGPNKKVLFESNSHVYNAMALVSSRIKDIVEEHCRSLLTKHTSSGLMLSRAASFRLSSLYTYRGMWFDLISNKCAFCSRTVESIIAANASTGKATALDIANDPSILDNVVFTDPRKDKLAGSPFDHDILCCRRCEVREWPHAIQLEVAVARYKLPESLLLFPPRSLQVGKSDKGYNTEERYLQDHGKDRSTAITFLDEEVQALRDLLISDTTKYVPAWMPELPGCCAPKKEVKRIVSANRQRIIDAMESAGADPLRELDDRL